MTMVTSTVVRAQLLQEAASLVPAHGFSNEVLELALLALRSKGPATGVLEWKAISSQTVAPLFSRGFPIAVVEHVVRESNRNVCVELNRRFTKENIFFSRSGPGPEKFTDANAPEVYVPSMRDVVEAALLVKLRCLAPYVSHWPQAVSMELQPGNAPYALLALSEFVDTTCYFGERMTNLKTIVDAGSILLRSRISPSIMAEREPKVTAVKNALSSPSDHQERFFLEFSSNIPLSSGPHLGSGLLDYQWYFSRAKVAACYSLAMTSFVGEQPSGSAVTEEFLRSLVATVF